MEKRFLLKNIHTDGKCAEKAIVQGENYRFSILTSRLIRMEYDETGRFLDAPTQMALNRNFPVPEFYITKTDNEIRIITDDLIVIYGKGKFSPNSLSVKLRGKFSLHGSIWYYGQETDDLKGTARTLDGADGAVDLEDGIMSVYGFSVLDDKKSLILLENGFVKSRRKNIEDIYFFGYGRDYLQCLKDFYHLSGNTPLLPKYALGNWWSRYYRYSENEYKELIESFQKEKIPFSVAVLDMDWHLTEVPYGCGWTGYTWNRELFPDPEEFLSWLHEQGLAVTLNVHPADGIQAHEEAYEAAAQEMGVNVSKNEPIEFDIANPKFLEVYFKYLHHPNEKMGVDFWWIDWQQGTNTKIEGLDPLWMLNHFHMLDKKREGSRAFIFSRYAGPGSHRYPAGFSGDTVISWESLDFQPYFTANASNIGFSWWSHDIGGHMNGVRDDELAARWIQFGVFSPIMRLHSSCNEFNRKEPRFYNRIIRDNMSYFLRLRHQLIPYLYSMNYLSAFESLPLIRPLYYHHPYHDEAYCQKNEYYFGTELLVNPITQPVNRETQLGKVKTWLPEGIWFDFFKGILYTGNRNLNIYRGIEEMPVLAKAGAIIPMAAEELSAKNKIENPAVLEVRIFCGADGSFSLYEDFDSSKEAAQEDFAKTEFLLQWGKQTSFSINPVTGNQKAVPHSREYHLYFVGVGDCKEEDILVKSKDSLISVKKDYKSDNNILLLTLCDIKSEMGAVITLTHLELAQNHVEQLVFERLNAAQISYDIKSSIFNKIKNIKDKTMLISELLSMEIPEELLGCIMEILTASLK